MAATLSISQGAQVTFLSTTYDTAATTLSIYVNNVLASTGVSTSWQDLVTPDWAVSFHSADGTCVERTGGTSFPSSAALGVSGAYLTGKDYPGCSPANMPQSFWVSSGTLTTTWTYSSINGTGFVCFNSSDAGFVGTTTESDCIEVIDTAGTLGTHARITVKDLNNVTTTLTN
jgi:hypothetical protein